MTYYNPTLKSLEYIKFDILRHRKTPLTIKVSGANLVLIMYNVIISPKLAIGQDLCQKGSFFGLEEYLIEKYLDIKPLLRFGRLPVHEMLKVVCSEYGENSGYEVKVEYKTGMGGTRIDVVYFKNKKIAVTIEIDEGINFRAIKKMYWVKSPCKIFVFFDSTKMAQRAIDSFDFKDINVIQLPNRQDSQTKATESHKTDGGSRNSNTESSSDV